MTQVKNTIPGSAPTLSVAEYKAMIEKGVPLKFFKEAKKYYSIFHFEAAGDHALYYSSFINEFMPSAIVPASKITFELPRVIDPSFGNTTFMDIKGKAHPPMSEYVNAGYSRLQAMMMIHKGKVVYETYPGMRSTDRHIWMSATKPVTGSLVVDLILDGKMDPEASIVEYVPELKGSAWDDVPLQAVLNMTTGLDPDEMADMHDAGGVVNRYFLASFGEPYNGKVEGWLDVVRDAKKVAEPLTKYQYATLNTQVLGAAVENVTQKRLVDYAYERIFQYAGTKQMVAGLFPDGTLQAGTAMNSTLEDLGRFGLLYTPTYKKITGQEVISQKFLDHVFATKVPADLFYASTLGKAADDDLGSQRVSGSSSQFDFLWEDGALAKLGHNNQGLYIDPAREFVSVYFGDVPESVLPNYPIGYSRAAALSLDK